MTVVVELGVERGSGVLTDKEMWIVRKRGVVLDSSVIIGGMVPLSVDQAYGSLVLGMVQPMGLILCSTPEVRREVESVARRLFPEEVVQRVRKLICGRGHVCDMSGLVSGIGDGKDTAGLGEMDMRYVRLGQTSARAVVTLDYDLLGYCRWLNLPAYLPDEFCGLRWVRHLMQGLPVMDW